MMSVVGGPTMGCHMKVAASYYDSCLDPSLVCLNG